MGERNYATRGMKKKFAERLSEQVRDKMRRECRNQLPVEEERSGKLGEPPEMTVCPSAVSPLRNDMLLLIRTTGGQTPRT